MACWWNATVQPIPDHSDPSKVSFILGVCFFANTSSIDELQRARKMFAPNQMTSVMMWALFLFVPHAVAILCSLIERRLSGIWRKSPDVKPPMPVPPPVPPIEQPPKKDNPPEPLPPCKPIDPAVQIVYSYLVGNMVFAALGAPQPHSPPPPPPSPQIVWGTPPERPCKHEVRSIERTKRFTRWGVTVFCVVAGHWVLRRAWRYSRAEFGRKIRI